MIVAGMKNHIYKFGEEIRKQKSGGPIGLGLTGEVADCYMIEWDKKFLDKLKQLGIPPIIYLRFKDDTAIVIKSLEKGSKFENGKLFIDQQKYVEDETKNNEEITMEVLKQIAESVDEMLKFTIDLPSKHGNGKLPVLDIQVNINKDKNNRIDFEFFEKPTKNNKVILSDAAIPSHQKRTILTQECLRRLRNTKVELGQETQVKHLNNFMLKMKNSGYSPKYRKEILDSALKAFEKMQNDAKNNIKPLYRNRSWNQENRKTYKENRKHNWYKNKETENNNKVNYKTVLFVPMTMGSKLAKEIKIREEEINRFSSERIKIVEDGGVKLKDLLVKKDPFPSIKCDKKFCFVCESVMSKNSKIPCSINNFGYQLACESCRTNGKEQIYEGESSRSARIRGEEHYRMFKNNKSESALFKHKQKMHQNEEKIEISMKITQKFKDPLTRQANEAVRINNRKSGLLNSKSEFNHPPIARVILEKKAKF